MKRYVLLCIGLMVLLGACGTQPQVPTSPTMPDSLPLVSLLIFSGRPDPHWTLTEAQAAKFDALLSALPAGDSGEVLSRLGYRGLRVERAAQGIQLYDGLVAVTENSRTLWYVDAERALELWLLETAGDAIDANLLETVKADFALPEEPVGEGFAIYLVDAGLRPHDVFTTEVGTLPLVATPILSQTEVVAYDAETYQLMVTDVAHKRIADLQVPVSGLAFVVCVDREPIYAGAFWAFYSSLSFDGVVVMTSPVLSPDALTFALGYPGPDFFVGEDLRNDPRILEALRGF